MRKVIIVRNTVTQELKVYSNRKKVFELHESRLTVSYQKFCKMMKQGVKIRIPQGMGIEDPAVIREYVIN